MVPQHIEDTWQRSKNGWTDVNDVKVVAVDGRVLVELRDANPSLQQKHGWNALSRLSDLARLSLDGITIVDGQVTELKLVGCGLTSKSCGPVTLAHVCVCSPISKCCSVHRPDTVGRQR